MFTGLIQEKGKIKRLEQTGGGARLTVASEIAAAGAAVGDSIAVNGVCLTVTAVSADGFSADVMNETLRHSTLGELTPGAAVNLEKSLTLQTPLGGHLVLGDVEAVGVIRSVERDGFALRVTVAVPVALSRYIVTKGRITVDGASLTVCGERSGEFSVSLIPHTQEAIRLGDQSPGGRVNVETDIVAKYLEKLVQPASGAEITENLLKKNGFWG